MKAAKQKINALIRQLRKEPIDQPPFFCIRPRFLTALPMKSSSSFRCRHLSKKKCKTITAWVLVFWRKCFLTTTEANDKSSKKRHCFSTKGNTRCVCAGTYQCACRLAKNKGSTRRVCARFRVSTIRSSRYSTHYQTVDNIQDVQRVEKR